MNPPRKEGKKPPPKPPPGASPDAIFAAFPGLKKALRYVPARRKADALQEAWLAWLEGKDPRRAVWRFNRREATHERRAPGIEGIERADVACKVIGPRRKYRGALLEGNDKGSMHA